MSAEIINDMVLTIKKSTRKNKKLMVLHPEVGWIHFGDTRYQHYRDKTGIWSHLDHNDDERRRNYLKRAKKITSNGKLTAKDITSPNYWAINILW